MWKCWSEHWTFLTSKRSENQRLLTANQSKNRFYDHLSIENTSKSHLHHVKPLGKCFNFATKEKVAAFGFAWKDPDEVPHFVCGETCSVFGNAELLLTGSDSSGWEASMWRLVALEKSNCSMLVLGMNVETVRLPSVLLTASFIYYSLPSHQPPFEYFLFCISNCGMWGKMETAKRKNVFIIYLVVDLLKTCTAFFAESRLSDSCAAHRWVCTQVWLIRHTEAFRATLLFPSCGAESRSPHYQDALTGGVELFPVTPKLEPTCETSRFPQSKRGGRAASRISKLSARLLVSPEPLCGSLPGVDAASGAASHNKGGLNWTPWSRELPVAQFGGPDVQKRREFTFVIS